MNVLSPGARRAATRTALCAACVLAGISLPQLALAAPAAAIHPPAATSAAPGELALRIGALSERLFDTAAAAEWPSAQAALQTLHEQAAQLDAGFMGHYDLVSGRIQDFYAARNSLFADLAQGDIAAQAHDSDGLSSVANRITLIAGELAQPFADAHGAPLALKVDAAMFQARRMRDALVWGDTLGYESAHQSFLRLRRDLRHSPGLDPAKIAALNRALTLAALSRNAQIVDELQRAAQDLVGSVTTATRSAQ